MTILTISTAFCMAARAQLHVDVDETYKTELQKDFPNAAINTFRPKQSKLLPLPQIQQVMLKQARIDVQKLKWDLFDIDKFTIFLKDSGPGKTAQKYPEIPKSNISHYFKLLKAEDYE